MRLNSSSSSNVVAAPGLVSISARALTQKTTTKKIKSKKNSRWTLPACHVKSASFSFDGVGPMLWSWSWNWRWRWREEAAANRLPMMPRADNMPLELAAAAGSAAVAREHRTNTTTTVAWPNRPGRQCHLHRGHQRPRGSRLYSILMLRSRGMWCCLLTSHST